MTVLQFSLDEALEYNFAVQSVVMRARRGVISACKLSPGDCENSGWLDVVLRSKRCCTGLAARLRVSSPLHARRNMKARISINVCNQRVAAVYQDCVQIA